MRPSFRPSTPADAPGIAALLSEVFGVDPGASIIEPRHMHWKYWQARADWQGSRSFVLARGHEILAHAGIVPGTCSWGTERRRFLHLIDWAARPDAVSAGVVLLKHLGRLADAVLAVGGSEQTLAILPALGFQPHGTSTQFVRVLRPLRSLENSAAWGRRAVPKMVARGLLATMSSGARRGAEWRVRAIPPDALTSDAPPLPAPTATMAVLERSATILGHALECPAARMALYAVERVGRIRGYFLLAFVSGQARLADCWIDTAAPADWRALIELAIKHAREEGNAGRLLTSASDPLLSSCLVDCGFIAGRVDPVQLLATNERSLPETTLRVQMLDNDFAWL